MRLCTTAMHLPLRCLHRCGRHSRSRLPRRLKQPASYVKLLIQSLYFNSLTTSEVVMDCILEPVLWAVEVITHWFGMVFVFLLVTLTSSATLIAYVSLLPLILQTYSLFWIMWHICLGNWIIVMIAFHYYKAITTPPGYPLKMENDIPFVSFCKKCVIPKPARSHHCGICKTCILKMDHHCPWLNNCVGHFNHRYFFSFCVSLTLGCMYCTISCRNLFIDAYNTIGSGVAGMSYLPAVFLPFHSNSGTWRQRNSVPGTGIGLLIGMVTLEATAGKVVSEPPITYKDRMFHESVIYMWVLTSTVAVATGALTLWHAVLITRGETSIERHINSKESKRLAKHGKIYRNPFNYGKLNNWKVFLGVEKNSHWLTRVILPSGHTPYGDGLTWDIYPLKKDIMPV